MPFTPYNSGQPSTATAGAKPTPGFTPFNASPVTTNTPPTQQGVIGNYKQGVLNAAQSGVNQIKKGYNQFQEAGANPLKLAEAGVTGASGVINTLFSSVAPLLSPVSKAVGVVSDKISDVPAVQKFAASPAGEVAIRGAEDVSNLSNVAGAVGGIKASPTIATEASNIASDVTTLAKNALPEAKPPVLNEAAVAQKYNKAIKPSVAGKNTQTQIQQANTKAVSGVKTIADNKANLSFTDDAGNTITGQTPKSVDQLSQAIEQTKKTVFSQYNALAKQAGEQGINVDTKAIAQELQPIIESKSLAIANPRAVQYAKDVQTRLNSVGAIDAETAQDVIKHYNDSLKAFYRNPNYDTASQAGIDSMIANQFRTKLDEGISGATGAQYQSLKNQYGALASIEKDVAKRAQTLAKSAPSGFINTISNMASGAELVKGLVTLSPSSIAKAGAIKGIEAYMKYLNNPDVGVSKMFSQIEKSNSTPKVSQASTPFQPKSNTVKGIMSAAEKYKSIPNKDGGFVKIGGQTFKEIPEATKKEMIQSIDYLRLSKELDSAAEKQVDRLAQKYNISQDLSSVEISNKLEQLIENTKTK